MEIKVCGMRDPGNIRQLVRETQPDWMGLIFYERSPRFVADGCAETIRSIKIKKVGVFVNEGEAETLRKTQDFGLSALQLHGNESVDFVQKLAEKTDCEIWKVIPVQRSIDWRSLEGYLPFVHKFLFDTATLNHGGSGKKFDWTVLQTYPFDKGFLLSGGLDEESVEGIITLKKELSQLVGVDLNSRFEQAPGLKDIEKINRFKQKLKRFTS